jgi:hypothetical protein
MKKINFLVFSFYQGWFGVVHSLPTHSYRLYTCRLNIGIVCGWNTQRLRILSLGENLRKTLTSRPSCTRKSYEHLAKLSILGKRQKWNSTNSATPRSRRYSGAAHRRIMKSYFICIQYIYQCQINRCNRVSPKLPRETGFSQLLSTATIAVDHPLGCHSLSLLLNNKTVLIRVTGYQTIYMTREHIHWYIINSAEIW